MDLQQFRKLARNWDAFGDADPLFGVLSDPTKFGGQWRVDDFFASGDAHVKKWLRILGELGATFRPGTCLDFGCGVGRLTRPLAESFLETVGVDVAKSMIEVARRYNRNPRCRFAVNRDPDLRAINAGTFVVAERFIHEPRQQRVSVAMFGIVESQYLPAHRRSSATSASNILSRRRA